MMSSVSASTTVFVLTALCVIGVTAQSFNPSILQDSRDLPKVDGTFGFLYRTEDGIAHAAKGGSDGIIHGRFTYTDPTGLKVNYNYNAGSRVAPGYNYKDQAPVSNYRSTRPTKYYTNPETPQPAQPAPVEPEYEDQPEIREPQYRRPSSRRQPQFRDADDVYQERRTRPSYLRQNEVSDYNYRN